MDLLVYMKNLGKTSIVVYTRDSRNNGTLVYMVKAPENTQKYIHQQNSIGPNFDIFSGVP